MTGPTPPTPPSPSSPSTVGWLPRSPEELFGAGAGAAEAYGLLTVDVPAERWIPALRAARDELGCTYFDWLSAVDEPGTGLRVCAHLAALGTPVRRLLIRTTVPHEAPELPTATGVYAGAAWHERETREMFGISFAGHPHPAPLLLPDGFEGHPLRKDFVLAARVAKSWPGAKEPGESAEGGPRRRQTLPPGVPDPNEWGPLKGRLPPAPARPARGRAAAGDRPPRRMRSASAGSASQRAAGAAEATGTAGTAETPGATETAGTTPPRRMRSASEGSASQRAAAEPGRRGADAPWRRSGPSGVPSDTPPSDSSGSPAPDASAEAADRDPTARNGADGSGDGHTDGSGGNESGNGDGTTGGGA